LLVDTEERPESLTTSDLGTASQVHEHVRQCRMGNDCGRQYAILQAVGRGTILAGTAIELSPTLVLHATKDRNRSNPSDGVDCLDTLVVVLLVAHHPNVVVEAGEAEG